MEVAIPQLRQEGDFWEPVSWQPSDAKESMINNFGRIRYQVGKHAETATIVETMCRMIKRHGLVRGSRFWSCGSGFHGRP